jgi:Flp pilus assembly protein TadD
MKASVERFDGTSFSGRCPLRSRPNPFQKGQNMRKLPLLPVFVAFVGLFFFATLAAPAFAQGSAALKEGVAQYNQENYEEAITVLTQARAEDPSSAEAAFYLGMAYRQTNDIPNAYKQFEDAGNLKPLSDNTILELIEVSTLLDKLDTAEKWVGVAEEHKVYPARVAFLKGTLLAKQTKYDEAVASFEKCKQLDPAYKQSADFQIGICLMNQRKYAQARDRFQSAVTMDPLSDTATYARRYQEAAEQWRYIERPLRLTIGVTGQYDSNYRTLAEPYDEAPAAFNAYLESQDKRSFAMQNVVRLDFVPILPGRFVFNAGYAAMNTLHQRYGTDNDTFANSFTVAPGLNFGSFAVNLVGNYTHNLKRDQSYRRYSESASVGPLFRFLLSREHILELSTAFTKKNFFRTITNPELEEQTSSGGEGFLSWFWLFKENAIFNLKFGYTRDNADGIHYSNEGYRTSVNLIYPLVDKLRLQLGGDIYFQNYKNENTFFNNTVRKDRNYTGTIGLTWSVSKYVDLIAQYMYTRLNSNLYAYDYKRDVISLGMELKF